MIKSQDPRELYRLKRYNDALAALQNLTDKDSDYLRGLCYYRLGKYIKASKYIPENDPIYKAMLRSFHDRLIPPFSLTIIGLILAVRFVPNRLDTVISFNWTIWWKSMVYSALLAICVIYALEGKFDYKISRVIFKGFQ